MRSFRLALSCSLLLGALVFLHVRSTTGEAVPVRDRLDSFPTAFGDWQGREATIFELDVLNILKLDDYLMRRYVDGAGHSLWLYMGYWQTQRKGAQPHSPKNCLPGAGWEPLEASEVIIPLPPPHRPLIVNRYLLQKDRHHQLVFYWFQSQGRPIAGELAAKIEMVKSAIFRNRTDGALIRVSSPVYRSVPETSAWLTKYVQTIYPRLHDYFPE
jgi:EpsI family protein